MQRKIWHRYILSYHTFIFYITRKSSYLLWQLQCSSQSIPTKPRSAMRCKIRIRLFQQWDKTSRGSIGAMWAMAVSSCINLSRKRWLPNTAVQISCLMGYFCRISGYAAENCNLAVGFSSLELWKGFDVKLKHEAIYYLNCEDEVIFCSWKP